MRKRGTSWVGSEPLEILIRIEADDMNFDSAIGVAQSPLQQFTKLAQQREYGFLVGLKAGNPVRRYARNQDERQACRRRTSSVQKSSAPSEDMAPFQEVWRRYYRRGGIGSTMSAPGQSRRSDCAPMTSGLPRLADILRVRCHVSKVPKAEVYPQQSVQPATRHPSTWAQQAPRRLGTTRTRTDADGSRAIRNGRFQRPVPQLRRQKHHS
jgi:hypothetical protein